QHRDALAQGTGEVELAGHGTARDVGDLGADAGARRDVVEELVLDQRRFHVGDEQRLASFGGRQHRSVDRVLDQGRECGAARRRRIAGERDVGRDPRRQPVDGAGPGTGLGQSRARRGGNAIVQAGAGGIGDQDEDVGHVQRGHARGRAIIVKRSRLGKESPVIVVGGPTASGKSALALALAERLDGVVVNADAMQIYRELAILTARPTAEDTARVPHRLYGVISVTKPCTVARWRRLALAAIAAARREGRLPIVVGGTGLYLKALMEGLAAVP